MSTMPGGRSIQLGLFNCGMHEVVFCLFFWLLNDVLGDCCDFIPPLTLLLMAMLLSNNPPWYFFICNLSICIIFINWCQTWTIYDLWGKMRYQNVDEKIPQRSVFIKFPASNCDVNSTLKIDVKKHKNILTLFEEVSKFWCSTSIWCQINVDISTFFYSASEKCWKIDVEILTSNWRHKFSCAVWVMSPYNQ